LKRAGAVLRELRYPRFFQIISSCWASILCERTEILIRALASVTRARYDEQAGRLAGQKKALPCFSGTSPPLHSIRLLRRVFLVYTLDTERKLAIAERTKKEEEDMVARGLWETVAMVTRSNEYSYVAVAVARSTGH
jgi:hypothetical protein